MLLLEVKRLFPSGIVDQGFCVVSTLYIYSFSDLDAITKLFLRRFYISDWDIFASYTPISRHRRESWYMRRCGILGFRREHSDFWKEDLCCDLDIWGLLAGNCIAGLRRLKRGHRLILFSLGLINGFWAWLHMTLRYELFYEKALTWVKRAVSVLEGRLSSAGCGYHWVATAMVELRCQADRPGGAAAQKSRILRLLLGQATVLAWRPIPNCPYISILLFLHNLSLHKLSWLWIAYRTGLIDYWLQVFNRGRGRINSI